jgi:hypothetical protein
MAFADFGALIQKLNGIKFPAVQVPSADVNTLDDYEEGTFLPGFSFGGAAVGMSYTVRSGAYIKIGGACLWQMKLVLSAKGTSTGPAVIGPLPFTVGADNVAAFIGFVDGMASIVGGMTALAVATTTNVNVYQTGTGTSAQLTNANFTNTSQMYIGGVIFP